MKKRLLFIFAVIFVFAGFINARSNSATIENIKSAIKGESTASAKYAAYAKKAREEGYNNVALLFDAASKSEAIHAGNHKAVLSQLGEKPVDVKPEFIVKSTKENLQDAINGETYEVDKMYPSFMKTSKTEKVNKASISFNFAYQVEKKHQALYKDALAKLEAGKEKSVPSKYFVCSVCGNTYDSEPPVKCGVSMTSKEKFIAFN